MASVTYGELLRNKGIRAFLWTQFLGAFNDNVFKFIVSMAAMAAATGSAASDELSWMGAVFTAPFLLFSGYAGQLSDRYDKRTVLVATKALEIVSMALALAALTIGGGRLESAARRALPDGRAGDLLQPREVRHRPRSDARRGAVARQRPARDEHLRGDRDRRRGRRPDVRGWHHTPLLMGGALLAIAVAGTLDQLRHPARPGRRRHCACSSTRSRASATACRLRKNRALLLTALGIGYFWFIGALLQLVILLAGSESLHLDDVRIGADEACARRRHRRRQRGRGQLVGRQGRARPRADWRIRHGLRRAGPLAGDPVVSRRVRHAHAARLRAAASSSCR